METKNFTKIAINAEVNAPIETVWRSWSEPAHIVKWNQASEDWHAPRATNDLRTGGKFNTRMEAKDGSFGFDFEGEYTNVEEHKVIEYVLGDGRTVKTTFAEKDGTTEIESIFDAEDQNSIEMQRGGWQAILNSFKKYTEQL